MKTLLLIITMLLSSNVYSVTREISEDKIAIVDEALNKAKEAEAIKEKMDYVRIGSNIGAGVVSAAKEVGIPAMEFAGTTPGKFIGVMIFLKIFGSNIMHFIGGFTMLATGIAGIKYLIKRSIQETITYDLKVKNIFGNYVIKDIRRDSLSSDMIVGMTITGLAVLAISIIIMITG